jgi:hypothetical protein
MKRQIDSIIYTLERVSVRGAEDMSRMLGVMQALGNLKKELEQNEQSTDAAVRQREEAEPAAAVRGV